MKDDPPKATRTTLPRLVELDPNDAAAGVAEDAITFRQRDSSQRGFLNWGQRDVSARVHTRERVALGGDDCLHDRSGSARGKRPVVVAQLAPCRRAQGTSVEANSIWRRAVAYEDAGGGGGVGALEQQVLQLADCDVTGDSRFSTDKVPSAVGAASGCC